MKIYQYDKFPDLLIKFSTKREFLEDFALGKIYMNESGYFRRLEDNFRGDRYDGKCPLFMNTPEWYIEIGSTDDSDDVIRISYDEIKDFCVGFRNDDKIPLFCCSEISEEVLKEPINNTLYFKKEFVSEMEQFGDYYIIFYKHDFLQKMQNYAIEKGFGCRSDCVEYTDIKTAYDETIFKRHRFDIYDPFFVKDLSYKWQNEWRILFQPITNAIINQDQNYHIAQIPPLEKFYIGKVDNLINNTLKVYL